MSSARGRSYSCFLSDDDQEGAFLRGFVQTVTGLGCVAGGWGSVSCRARGWSCSELRGMVRAAVGGGGDEGVGSRRQSKNPRAEQKKR